MTSAPREHPIRAADGPREHQIRAADGWRLSVLDLEPAGPACGVVIAGHAMMADRRTYYRRDRPCLADALTDAGLRVLLPDLRGHGASGPRPHEGGDWSPFPDFAAIPPAVHVEMVLFAMMLSTVDIIEQVMSNAAIEKIDPLGRKADSNNSLLAIWIANGMSSFFGGMTNLDGLAKSSTNKMAGAVTKMSCLFVAAVLGAVLAYPHLLTYLPEFSLAILMIFTGWKMIAGLYHVAHHGKYAFALAMLCGILVFRLGIFEGLLISLALHSFITYVVYRAERLPTVAILKKFLEVFTDRKGHPHQSETLDVIEDAVSGGTRYVSVVRPSTAHKTLDDFIKDWAHGVDSHNLLAVVGTYDITGLLWGTFAKDLRSGHFHIKRYFEHLFELDDVKVRFDSGETRQYGEIYIRSGSYTFTYRKRGALVQVPARYSFVCKREKTGWYILEHHSSEFPS